MARPKTGIARWNHVQRERRRFNAGKEDQRKKFERDRDRVLYSSALRRLGGVSQVVSAEHIEPFHNRLTHTIKVAQLGRRLAEFFAQRDSKEAEIAGLDPEVVEAACLYTIWAIHHSATLERPY